MISSSKLNKIIRCSDNVAKFAERIRDSIDNGKNISTKGCKGDDLICSKKRGKTEPLEPITFPNLAHEKIVFFDPLIKLPLITILSASSFVAPMQEIGSTTLSVLICKNFFTLFFNEAITKFCVPITLVLLASKGLYSQSGTCFKAAACMTMSISSVATMHLSKSEISP